MNDIVRVVFAILIPPVAVYDKGWDKIIITTMLWMITGIGGNIAAFYFLFSGREYDRRKQQYFGPNTKNKRQIQPEPYRQNRNYIELADGDILEVVDTDIEERRQRLRKE